MTDLTMGDMSDPGTLIIREDIAAFYLGGWTPHVWTAAQVGSQTAKYRHPIWTYNPNKPGHDSGIIDGHNAVTAAKALGVHAEVAISIDMEDKIDAEYINAFRSVIAPAGFWTSIYGSASTVAHNPHWGGGYWVADWPAAGETGTPHFTNLEGEWACQWQAAEKPGNENPWDISAVKDATHLWDITQPAREVATLVRLPSGAASTVYSVNGGVTWQ